MKSPFAFANWNMGLGFLISWGVWHLLAVTAFAWGWLDISDGFAITAIFTVTSYARTYVLNHIQQYLLRRKPS